MLVTCHWYGFFGHVPLSSVCVFQLLLLSLLNYLFSYRVLELLIYSRYVFFPPYMFCKYFLPQQCLKFYI